MKWLLLAMGLPFLVSADSLGTELRLYLPMEAVIADSSIHKRSLEIHGAPASSGDATQGSSLRLDGTDDRIQVMPWRSTEELPGRDNLSFSLWFKAESDGAAQKRVLFDDAGKQDALAVRINWAISPSVVQATCRRNAALYSISAPFSNTTTWQHLVLVKENHALRLYLNGSLAAEIPDLTQASPSSVNAGVGLPFLGRIDEFRMYRRALQQNEITELGDAEALTPAEVWRGHHFQNTENSGEAADTEDPDGDHSTNRWERATGTDPKDGESVLFPSGELEEVEGLQYFSIRYRRLSGGAGTTGVDYTQDGLTWQVESRTELLTGTWKGGASEVVAVGEPIPHEDGTESVLVRRLVDTDNEPQSFLRVTVQ